MLIAALMAATTMVGALVFGQENFALESHEYALGSSPSMTFIGLGPWVSGSVTVKGFDYAFDRLLLEIDIPEDLYVLPVQKPSIGKPWGVGVGQKLTIRLTEGRTISFSWKPGQLTGPAQYEVMLRITPGCSTDGCQWEPSGQ